MTFLYKRFDEPPMLPLLGLLAYTISVYTELGERIELLGAIRHELIMGVVLVVICVGILREHPLSMRPYRLVILGIVLLFLAMATQIPFAYVPSLAWKTFFDRIIKQALFAFFIAVLIRSPRGLRWFMGAFLFSLFWVYQEAVRGLITGSLVWYNQGIHRLHGAVTLYRHPNGLSLIAVTCLPFVIYLVPAVRRRLLRLPLLVIGALAVVCIVYTGSRAGYIGTLAVLFFWWFLSRHKAQGLLWGIVLAIGVVFLLPSQYKERFASIGGEEAEGHSKERRLEIVEDAWQIFKEHPLGVGIDCFPPVRMETFGREQDTHNLYLQVATNLGIQGFLVFLFFVGALLWSFQQVIARQERLLRELRRLVGRNEFNRRTLKRLRSFDSDVILVRQVALAVRMYLLMLIVNGAFAHTLYLICWWLASGLAISLLSMTDAMEEDLAIAHQLLPAEAGRAGPHE